MYAVAIPDPNPRGPPMVGSISVCREQLSGVPRVVEGTPRGGGHTSISLTGMLVREQISTTQKNRMTLNSNPKKIECPKIQTQKNRMTQDAMVVKV